MTDKKNSCVFCGKKKAYKVILFQSKIYPDEESKSIDLTMCSKCKLDKEKLLNFLNK